MSLAELFIIAVGLSMDACAVSVCKGLSVPKMKLSHAVICGVYFGGFQGLMPLIGYLLGSQFEEMIVSIDHWIAFGLLLFIGGKMLIEGIYSLIKKEKDEEKQFSYKQIFIQGIATSIDALAVGVALITSEIFIAINALFICVITFLMCLGGILLGKQIIKLFKGKIEIATIIGGVILILIGVKIVLEHLGILILG